VRRHFSEERTKCFGLSSAMKEYRFEAPVVLGFTIRADSETEARRIAADLAIGKIDYASLPDGTLSGRPGREKYADPSGT
jgi:hypothetical protein